MKKTNFEVMDALRVLLRRVDRIREGFRLQKEDALEEGDLRKLEELRQRSRVYFRTRLAQCRREMLALGMSMSSELPAFEETQDMFERCRQEIADLDAHLVSTPSRLLRVYGEESASGSD
jgi:hypothetical protein